MKVINEDVNLMAYIGNYANEDESINDIDVEDGKGEEEKLTKTNKG